MSTNIHFHGADWLAAEDAAAREEREAGWHWAWGEAPLDESPRHFVWDFQLEQAADSV